MAPAAVLGKTGGGTFCATCHPPTLQASHRPSPPPSKGAPSPFHFSHNLFAPYFFRVLFIDTAPALG